MVVLKSKLKPLRFPLGEALLSDYVKRYAEEMPDKTAINYYGREVSYRELHEASNRVAGAIARMGYGKGDRLAIFLQPSPQCFILYLACMKLGIIAVPIDPMSKDLELQYFLNDSGARVVATMDQTYPIVLAVKEKCEVKDVIVTSFHDYMPKEPAFQIHPMMEKPKQTFHGTHEFLDLLEADQEHPPKVDVRLSDYGYILYTGGTTGWPKGCVHTQGDLIYCALGQTELNYNKATNKDKLFSSWPLTHISGISMSLAPTLLSGMTVFQLARWDPVAAMQAISKYRITVTSMAIPSYYDIINHPDVKNYDLSSLRVSLAVPFAIPITDEIVERWRKLTGCPLYDWGYGASELMNYCGYGYGLPFPRSACSTFSRPFPGVQIKIMDFETGKELAEEEEGEIVTKTPAQLKRYWNKPKETKETIVDGWVHMSDRGYIKDGILYFLGKASEVVKVSGYTVSLKEVEMLGMEHPEIEKIAVIPIPHSRKGNELKAFVVLRPGSRITGSDIEDWFQRRVSPFKVPRVEIRSSLPTSGKGETLKRELIREEEEKR